MPKASPPSILLKFQGRCDWPIEQEVDDWGLNAAQQESYVEQFRRILAAKNAWKEDQHDYFTLRRFLRARSYDLEKATAMWLNHLAFKNEWKVDSILQDFYFVSERDKFVKAYPQGYHKIDKMGRPIYIQLIGKVNVQELQKITTDERMIKYHIQEYERCRKVILPICSHLAGHHIDQTFGIMDVKGVGMSHLTGDVKRLMGLVTKYDQDNYPEMLGHICIINAPSIFRMLWSVVKGMIDPRTQSKIEILGTNYMEALTKWVDIENIPDWLGGKSQGQLVDDVGPWSDMELVARLGLDIEELRHGKAPPGPQAGMGPPSLAMSASSRMSFRQGAGPNSTDHMLPHGPEGLRRDSGMSEGFQSPLASSSHYYNAQSFRGSAFRSGSGVPHDLDERRAGSLSGQAPVMHGQRSPSLGSSSSQVNGVLPTGHSLTGTGQHGFAAIPESSAGQASASALNGTQAGASTGAAKPRTLVERVEALERMLPHQMERLRPQQGESGHTADSRHQVAHSTRSAPEGSLLNRLEVLEEAMDVLLAAQQASLQQQLALHHQQQQQQQKQQQRKDKSCGCCCVM